MPKKYFVKKDNAMIKINNQPISMPNYSGIAHFSREHNEDYKVKDLTAEDITAVTVTGTTSLTGFMLVPNGTSASNAIQFYVVGANTGLYYSSGIVFSMAGTDIAKVDSTGISLSTTRGPELLNETPSGTNPTIIPNKEDTTTGIGWHTTNSMSLIANSVSVFRVEGSAPIHTELMPAITNGGWIETMATVTTTNGTATQIAAISVAEGEMHVVEATFIGVKSDATRGGTRKIACCYFRQVGGNVTQLGADAAIFNIFSAGGYTCASAADTGNQTIDLNVTGAIGDTVYWKVIIRTMKTAP